MIARIRRARIGSPPQQCHVLEVEAPTGAPPRPLELKCAFNGLVEELEAGPWDLAGEANAIVIEDPRRADLAWAVAVMTATAMTGFEYPRSAVFITDQPAGNGEAEGRRVRCVTAGDSGAIGEWALVLEPNGSAAVLEQELAV